LQPLRVVFIKAVSVSRAGNYPALWGKRVESGQLLSEALELMVLGLGTVFVFLTILVFVTATMSALVKKYAPVQPAGQSPTGTPAQPEDQTLLAVIAAAIHAHRNRR
jgi:oxaloacetate decarboxylase (Na+ extruding) subunit gamma